MVSTFKAYSNDLIQWITQMRSESHLRCKRIPWSSLRSWQIVDGAIQHRGNHFFSIVGVRAHSNHPDADLREQPIIHQPEIGILGFLVRRNHNQLFILIQAKAEPGNIGYVQIAPTVQATFSNYTRVHGGRSTPYLRFFLKPDKKIISDSLQSEHGTRFLGKYNRNIIIEESGNSTIPVNRYWRWCSWKSIQDLLASNFRINTDARSVLASSNWYELAIPESPFEKGRRIDDFGHKLYDSFHRFSDDHNTNSILQDLEAWREQNKFSLEIVPLDQLKDWRIDEWQIKNHKARFQVQAYNVEVQGREVPVWDQPLLYATEQAMIFLICQIRSGVLHFLLRKNTEIGFSEIAQLGPSLQINSQHNQSSGKFDQYLAQLLAKKDAAKTHLTCMQSEEGGRFYKSIVRYSIIEIPDEIAIPDDKSACWVNLEQIHSLVKHQGILTNEVRSAVSMLLYYL
jgi:oxidase EvaA